jgi:hypothetical protein
MKRGVADLVLAIGTGKSSKKRPLGARDDEPESVRDHEDEGYESDAEQAMAGEELADALKSGDGARIAEAFRTMMDLCQ